MKYALILVFVCLQFSAISLAQELNLRLESGMGSVKMKDLKEINDLNLKALPFDAKLTSDFPMYWYYKPSLEFSFKKILTIGIEWAYLTSGSRISLMDYSGEYSFDTKIMSSSPAILVELWQNVSDFKIAFGNEFGYAYTNVGYIEILRIGTDTQKSEDSFKSESWFYEPSIRISYPISRFNAGIVVGYLLDSKDGNLYGAKNKNIVLQLPNSSYVRSDWSGIRLGLTLSYNLLRRSQPATMPLDY